MSTQTVEDASVRHPGPAARAGARRAVLVTSALAITAVALAVVGLTRGDYPLTLPELARALTGDGGFATTVVIGWRLPRVAAALALGAALAVAGALFQSLTRNPLGSPDVVGFSTGSYTGVLVATTVIGPGSVSTVVAALAGGLLTAVVVYALAYRDGVQGFRLIIVGVATAALLHAVNTWLLLRAQTEVAMTASIWGAGSLGLVGWARVGPALGLLAALGVGVVVASPLLRQLELGDDLAASHGVRVEPARLVILGLGVALTATATATAGPIAFVALSSPQVARRLVGGAGLPLVASALTGSALLLGADLVTQHVLPTELPVGVVTVVLGGAYLLALLVGRVRTATR